MKEIELITDKDTIIVVDISTEWLADLKHQLADGAKIIGVKED